MTGHQKVVQKYLFRLSWCIICTDALSSARSPQSTIMVIMTIYTSNKVPVCLEGMHTGLRSENYIRRLLMSRIWWIARKYMVQYMWSLVV